MKKDAELHADEDKRKRELADARNQADQQCFQLEKMMQRAARQAERSRPSAAEADRSKRCANWPRETTLRPSSRPCRIWNKPPRRWAKSSISRLKPAERPPTAGVVPGGQRRTRDPSATDDEAIDAEFEVKSLTRSDNRLAALSDVRAAAGRLTSALQPGSSSLSGTLALRVRNPGRTL